MFIQYQLNIQKQLFNDLATSVPFEDITNGRKGTNIIVKNDNQCIPIVRTTTQYNKPASFFKPIHYELLSYINQINSDNRKTFNNALVEIYDNRYKSMGFHSDQAQDLQPNSFICIYSCYDDHIESPSRALIVKNKQTDEEMEFTLNHNSIILFSTETNKNYLHKIIYKDISNKWLGITFRLSKTFIKFINEIPYLTSFDNQMNQINQLNYADDKQKKEFYKCRSLENKQIDYTYPDFNFTISKSDLLYPI